LRASNGYWMASNCFNINVTSIDPYKALKVTQPSIKMVNIIILYTDKYEENMKMPFKQTLLNKTVSAPAIRTQKLTHTLNLINFNLKLQDT